MGGGWGLLEDMIFQQVNARWSAEPENPVLESLDHTNMHASYISRSLCGAGGQGCSILLELHASMCPIACLCVCVCVCVCVCPVQVREILLTNRVQTLQETQWTALKNIEIAELVPVARCQKQVYGWSYMRSNREHRKEDHVPPHW